MTGAYVLARFADPEKFLPAIRQIDNCPPVERWHAVDGHVHLVMKVAASSQALPEELRRLDGVDRLISYDIKTDDERDTIIDPEQAHAYVFSEAEPAKVEAIRAALKTDPSILFVSPTKGGCDLVALIAGGNFDVVDRTVNEKIRLLDGVTRVKHDRVIELTHL